MKARLCYLTDVLGNRYLGFKFRYYELEGYLDKWYGSFAETMNFDTLTTLTTNRDERDGDHYHCTFVNVMDYKKLTVDTGDLIGQEIEFDVLGIGKAEDPAKGNQAHFIVLECDELNIMRGGLGLPAHDFHITIGFDKKDVFGKPKNYSTIYIPFK